MNELQKNKTVWEIEFKSSFGDEKIHITEFEKQVIELLAEGRKIYCQRDINNLIASVTISDFTAAIDLDKLILSLPTLNRKGLINFENNHFYIISPMGSYVVRKIDREEKRYG